jgi:2EXR family
MEPSTPPKPTFHLFSALPTELRLVIWRLSLPRRVIEVRTNAEIITPDGQMLPPVRVGHPLCRTPLPSIFGVCREGHGVVLESYRNCHGTAFSAAEYEPGVGSLFNPTRDVVYLRPYYGNPPRGFPRRDIAVLPEVGELLSGERLLGRMAIEAEDVKDITALAVGWLEVVAQDVQGLIALLRKFESLQELTLIMMEEHDDSWRFGLANRIRHRKGQVTLLERADAKLSAGCARVVERNIALVTRFQNALMDAQKAAEDGWKPPDVCAMIARRGD